MWRLMPRPYVREVDSSTFQNPQSRVLNLLEPEQGDSFKAVSITRASLPIMRKAFAILGLALMVIGSSASPGSSAVSASSRSTLIGGELWLSNSVPFQADAATSVILALPTISAWLSSHSISLNGLKPYLSVWPSQGNPYDYAQTIVSFLKNDTVYGVYSYILPNGTVIAAWVRENSAQHVEKIFTYASESNATNSFSFAG